MRDDVRKLMGGYATGSLTEAERQLLFEAALDDQELFEELAREDELRELLAAPGAKQRMIAALETPTRTRWWARPWAWVVAGAGAAAVFVATTRLQTVPPPAQIALQQEARSPEVAALKNVPRPEPPARVPAIPTPRAKVARQESAVDAVMEKKAEADQTAQALGGNAVTRGAIAAAPVSPPPPPAPAAEKQLFRLKDAKTARFAFDYALDGNGRLRITPVADGYLNVEFVSGDEVEAAPGNGRVQAGTPVSIQVPSSANAVSIRFSMTPAQKPGEALARRDALTGTVEDPNPSPDSRLVIQLRVPPRK